MSTRDPRWRPEPGDRLHNGLSGRFREEITVISVSDVGRVRFLSNADPDGEPEELSRSGWVDLAEVLEVAEQASP